ncbi:MAG: DUF3365 domain-containing protein [Pseudomonadota bacterium]
MKNKLIISFILASLSFSHSSFATEVTQAELDLSHKIVKQFMGKLKGELVGAMKKGGPLNAIKVCNSQAIVISQEVSTAHKMDVARTSLKLRNPNNIADSWETKVLQNFEKRKAAGEPVKTMEYAEIVDNNGVKQFRYMKAIPVAKPCLSCHGEKVKAEVLSKLASLYPADKATGYKLGDIRGAFTITKDIK